MNANRSSTLIANTESSPSDEKGLCGRWHEQPKVLLLLLLSVCGH